MLIIFQGLLSAHFLGIICSALTSYWYTFSYHLLEYILSSYFAPSFSRLSGFTGNYAISPQTYCILFAILMFVISGVSATLSVLKLDSIMVGSQLVSYSCIHTRSPEEASIAAGMHLSFRTEFF